MKALALALLGAMILLGCGDTETKEEEEDIIMEPAIPETQKRAEEIVEQFHHKRAEVVKNVIATEDFSTFKKDLDLIFRVEVGKEINADPEFTQASFKKYLESEDIIDPLLLEKIMEKINLDPDLEIVRILFETHFKENPHGETQHYETPVSDINLIAEYLQIKFEHPEKNTEELLALFSESVKKGNTTVNPETVAKRYDFYTLTVVPDALARKKAREIVKDLYQKERQWLTEFLETGKWPLSEDEEQRIRTEKTQIDSTQRYLLHLIYRRNSPETVPLEHLVIVSGINISDEYLQLSFKYPEERSHLINLYTQMVRDGKVTRDVKKIVELYDFYIPLTREERYLYPLF